jgi:hypothetical protein
MGVDIRFPIGLMFTILGVVLTIFGLSTSSDPEMYKKSLDININLWTGLASFIFGGLMLFFALRTRKKRKK